MFFSTRNNTKLFTASEALLLGIARDGGLFLPTEFHQIDVASCLDLSYQELAFKILRPYLDDFSDEEVRNCIEAAYSKKNFPERVVGLKHMEGKTFLELFHGPTLTFKDMALSLLPHLMEVALKKHGKNVTISRGAFFQGISNVTIGNNVFIGPHATFYCLKSEILIGDNVMLGPNVSIVTGDHRYNLIGKTMMEISNSEKTGNEDQPVVFIGDNWVGANAVILKGVTIGEGAIVAAGAVVTKNVPNYSIVAGNPAKVIKRRFTEEEIAAHKKILEDNYVEK